MKSRFSVAALSVVTLLACLPGLGARGRWESADGRPPLVARDIVETGRVAPPYLAGEPYLNKPPLFHALVAGSFAIFGEGRVSARLPATLAALVAVLLTAVLAARTGGATAGVAAGIAMLATHRFFTMARSSELETLLVASACMIYVGMDAALRWRGPRRTRGMILACAGAVVAAWTKGPLLALLFPSAFAMGAVVTRRSWRPLVRSGLPWAILAALLATLAYYLPMYLDAETRAALDERLALRNNAHRRGPFYYVGKLPPGMLPALLLLPWMVGAARGQWKTVAPFAVSAAIGVVVFSVFPAKQSHYLLPLYPLLCAWAGVAVVRLIATSHRWPFWLAGGLGAVVGIVGAPLAIVRFDGVPIAPATIGMPGIAAGCGLATLWVMTGPRPGATRRRSAIACLSGLALVASMATFDTYQAHVRDEERSAEPAMTSFRAVVGSAPVASLDRKATVLYYLDRDDVQLPVDAAAGRAFLLAHPQGYLVIQHERGDVIPDELGAASIARAWQSPSGRRGFLLLGPGM